jgi:hypothetical protein
VISVPISASVFPPDVQALDNIFTPRCSDGLHFTPTGNKILFDEVVQTLASIGFSNERLPYDLPLYPEIDPKDPMKAFGA